MTVDRTDDSEKRKQKKDGYMCFYCCLLKYIVTEQQSVSIYMPSKSKATEREKKARGGEREREKVCCYTAIC